MGKHQTAHGTIDLFMIFLDLSIRLTKKCSMKKIAFVALNSSWSQSNLALYYMREMIRDLDFDMVLASFSMNEPFMQILQGIYSLKADVICLSAYIWNRMILSRLQHELSKIMPRVIFVIGGPEVGHFEGRKRCHIIHGPGEATFRALAEADFKVDATVKPEPISLKDIPFPYVESDQAQLAGHLVYYESYRGCPYRCIYCLSSCDERREPRFVPSVPAEIHKLQSELKRLSGLRPRTLKFIDRSFNLQKDLAHAIYRYILQENPEHDSHFEIYPDLLDESDFEILEKIPEGKIRFEIGIQSTNSEVLSRCGRHSDWDKARKAMNRLKASTQVRIHADLIAGLPGEDLTSVLRSIDELCACEPAAIQLGMLKVLPDTPMNDMAKDLSYIWLDDPPYQVMVSNALTYDELCLLDVYAHLLSLYWNKEEFTDLWHDLLKEHPASLILKALRDLHIHHSLPFHSVSRDKRFEIMEELKDHLY
nr:hypothetical protein [Candidatus Cloacimonadota bacterium]